MSVNNNNPQSNFETNKDAPLPLVDLSSISIEEIVQDAIRHCKTDNNESEVKGLFIVKGANKWLEQAKARPVPKMLFGEFWFEGELCILFADTNLGKSILAVQIGNSTSNGEGIHGFTLEAPPQKVLYFDFELSDKQFENRYSSNFSSHYVFNDNFIRVEVNPDANIPEGQTFEEFLSASLEQAVIDTGAKILIIDNLTYLKNETEKAKDALPLMKQLKALKTKHSLSILALAHTPKRDLSKPLTKNDLQGSKMLINFCDSAFTVGESFTDKNVRYLKQIKQRNTEQVYDIENVVICQITKPGNFLRFEFIGYGNERDHLRQQTDKDQQKTTAQVKELKQQGKSLREIGVQLGISHMKVSRILKDCNTP